MYEHGWVRNLHLGWGKIIQHKEALIITERNTYLTKVNIDNGESLWTVRVNTAYGFITAYDNRVYYLEQNGLMKVIHFDTGSVLRTHQFSYPYLGYVAVNNEYIITGSWRGYTDLFCFKNEESLLVNWTRAAKSKDLVSYSIPIIRNSNLLIADNSFGYIICIDLKSGRENWKVELPENIGKKDNDYTFQVYKGNIKFYSESGSIYGLDEGILKWRCEVKHTSRILTIKPHLLEQQYIFQDSQNFICSYDMVSKRLRWKIYSNHFAFQLAAIELANELTLIGLTMGKLIVVNKIGEVISEIGNEKRYGSDFIKINNDLFYATKSEVKQLKRAFLD